MVGWREGRVGPMGPQDAGRPRVTISLRPEPQSHQKEVGRCQCPRPGVEQLAGALEARRPGTDRDDPQRLAQRSRPPGRVQGPRALARLNDHHRVGKGDQHAIASEERESTVVLGREGPDRRARPAGNLGEEPCMLGRKAVAVARRRDDPRAASGLEGPPVSGSVDAHGAAGHDDGALARKDPGKTPRIPHRRRRRLARAHDADHEGRLESAPLHRDRRGPVPASAQP